jgi:AraC-like DNA-binding protein/mannose-6-phosphate isomerase-like protein (cupin superfamily)
VKFNILAAYNLAILRQIMLNPRQNILHDTLSNNPDPRLPVIAVAHDRPDNFNTPFHHHLRAQLVYATAGVMRVSTETATWVVPPQQAVWIPSNVEHTAVSNSPLALRTLYIHPDAASKLADICCVLSVPPLLREMILYAVTLPQDYAPDSAEARLMAVIPDLLSTLEPEPLQLPLPSDRRLRTITDALMEDPADKHSLAYWANHVGASERTLSRHFRNETGISFNDWRQRLRLLWSITLLSSEKSVTAVAYELGYESPSSFIAMFRRELGLPPKRYLQLHEQGSQTSGEKPKK